MSNCKNQKNITVNVILSQNDEWQVISILQYTPQPGLEKSHHFPFYNIVCCALVWLEVILNLVLLKGLESFNFSFYKLTCV
jgi:hypothetical protein